VTCSPHGAPRVYGFTLTELTVVMVIVALLIGGLLVPLSAQVEIRNINETRKALAEIREALLGYAAVNGYLPCPALPTTASGAANAGMESSRTAGGNCDLDAGVLPWATLGLNESDAWGRRFSYRPTAAFTNSATRVTLTSSGNITVLSAAVGGSPVASDVPAIVVSHGANGNGAHTSLGTQLAVGADPDELENQVVLVTTAWTAVWTDGRVARTFVKRSTPTPGYDDEVAWLPPGLFFNRMLGAGKLP